MEFRQTISLALILLGLFPINLYVQAQDTNNEEFSIVDPIDLDIFVFGLVVSSDERYVIAWGNTPQQIENDPKLLDNNGGALDVRVVDLEERSVIARGTFPWTPVSVVADESSIFVALSEQLNPFKLNNAQPRLGKEEIHDALNDLYVFDLKTMQQSKIRMPMVPAQLDLLPEKRIGVRGASEGQTSFSILETQTDRPRVVENSFFNTRDTSFARRNATQVEVGGAVFDLTKNRIVSVSLEPRYDSITEPVDEARAGPANFYQKSRSNYPIESRDWLHPFRFGRQLVSGHVYDLQRNQLFSIRSNMPRSHLPLVLETISETQPVCYSVSMKDDFKSQRELCYLNTFLLVDGQRVGEPVLLFSQSTQRPRSPKGKTATAASATKIVIANRSQIFDYRLPYLDLTPEEKPLTLLWPDKPLILANQVERFVVPHDGGRGKIEFALTNQNDGVQIDTNTGEITVDAPKLWQQFAIKSASIDRPDIEIINAIEADGKPREFSSENAPPSRIFKNLYGYSYELNQIPAHLKLEVFASDNFGQTARLFFYITILGEIETVKAAKKLSPPDEIPQPGEAARRAMVRGLGPERIQRLKTLTDLERRAFSLENKAKAISEKIEKLPLQK